MPVYTSPSSFAVEDDGGSVASMASLASKESQVGSRWLGSASTRQAGHAKFLTLWDVCVFCRSDSL